MLPCRRCSPGNHLRLFHNSPDGCGRHVGERAGLLARYGVNKFIVKYPVWFNEDYSDYMRHLTFYGRLINTDTVVNLDMEFTENEKVHPRK